jgi:hypothetical protein
MSRVLGQCLTSIAVAKKTHADEKSADYAQMKANYSSPRNDLVSLVEIIPLKSMEALGILSYEDLRTKRLSSSGLSMPKTNTSMEVGEIVHQLEGTGLTLPPERMERTNVLLVEDNIINMKVCYAPLI